MNRLFIAGKITAVLFLLILTLLPLAGENPVRGKLIAKWDFTGKSADGVDGNGRKIPMRVRSVNITTKNIHRELSPKAFRLTVVFRMPDKPFREQFLWENHAPQYGLGLMIKSWPAHFHIPVLFLGSRSGGPDRIEGPRLRLVPGKVYTLACEYDGNDKVTFRWKGIREDAVMTSIGGKISPSGRQSVIHCRYFGKKGATPGPVQKVLLEALPHHDVTLAAPYRCAFYRNEDQAKLDYLLINESGGTLKNCLLTFSGKDKILSGQQRIPELKEGIRLPVSQKVFTKLSVGSYPCRVRFEAVDGKGKTVSRTHFFTLRIAPLRHKTQKQGISLAASSYYKVPKDLPINHIAWGTYFTYGIPGRCNAGWQRPYFQTLDDIICDGHFFTDQSIRSSFFGLAQKFPRYDIHGKPYRFRNADALHPGYLEESRKFIKTFAETLKGHPAITEIQPSSEVRDFAFPSFTEHFRSAYYKYASAEIPRIATGKYIPYQRLSQFPANRIVPDDDPLLKYFLWYWKHGDGWNFYQDWVKSSYEAFSGRKIRTSYDPGVRVPPIWGSGGKVDGLGHWYYPHEPFDVTYLASELQAMARGCKDQKIELSIQGILYGNVAPTHKKVKNPPAWTKKFPKARYITTPPDLMTQALWSAFTRKSDSVGFYAIRSLVDYHEGNDDPHDGYKFTNPETIKAVGKVYRQVGRPFGPVFRLIPERKMEVAILESHASSVFANRGTWGWTGWIWECASILNMANLMPGTIYEEEIARDGFGSIKVLFMPHCDVLTKTTYEKILQFQKNGGIVIADRFLVPGILPDFTIPVYSPVKLAYKDKIEKQKHAAALLKKLKLYYNPYLESDNNDLRLWVRSSGKNDDWLFVINDKRTFGDYIGQYKILMEKGLPNAGTVSVRRKSAVVYDLLAHKKVPFVCENGVTKIRTRFKTNDGRLYLLRDRPFEKMLLKLSTTGTVPCGKVQFTVSIRDAALVPLQVTVCDPAGNPTDDSCYAALEHGVFKQTVIIPRNIRKGTWKITVRNLADGQTVSGNFIVK